MLLTILIYLILALVFFAAGYFSSRWVQKNAPSWLPSWLK